MGWSFFYGLAGLIGVGLHGWDVALQAGCDGAGRG